eukprot:TRINITY_DN12815_c0_g1_i1.p1 TRINITY_DN12815_c0_g1~~TRINITY_DN12815_c0_g1_i1.p1  ORF type:complete len:294 (-),score=43.61 TRINITY_DN12815_c0_g1_i1:274-1155(-)
MDVHPIYEVSRIIQLVYGTLDLFLAILLSRSHGSRATGVKAMKVWVHRTNFLTIVFIIVQGVDPKAVFGIYTKAHVVVLQGLITGAVTLTLQEYAYLFVATKRKVFMNEDVIDPKTRKIFFVLRILTPTIFLTNMVVTLTANVNEINYWLGCQSFYGISWSILIGVILYKNASAIQKRLGVILDNLDETVKSSPFNTLKLRETRRIKVLKWLWTVLMLASAILNANSCYKVFSNPDLNTIQDELDPTKGDSGAVRSGVIFPTCVSLFSLGQLGSKNFGNRRFIHDAPVTTSMY